jgi:hypothetical protein
MEKSRAALANTAAEKTTRSNAGATPPPRPDALDDPLPVFTFKRTALVKPW